MLFSVDSPILKLTITPTRSMTPRGAWLVIALVSGFCVVVSVPFILLGYWPVVGFYGLDLGLLAIAFRAIHRSSQQAEELILSPIELLFRRKHNSNLVQEWKFNPAWTRLDAERDEEFGISSIKLVSRGKHIVIGQFLGPNEKSKLLATLSSSLDQAKRGLNLNHETEQ